MRSKVALTVAAAVLAGCAAGYVHAGSEPEKCPLSTQECLAEMSKRLKSAGFIGVELERDTEKNKGLYTVSKVVPGSPAQEAGIQPGDVFEALMGVPMTVENEKKLWEVRSKLKSGSKITYTIRREGASRDITLTLAPMPADLIAKYIGEHMLVHAAQDAAAAAEVTKHHK